MCESVRERWREGRRGRKSRLQRLSGQRGAVCEGEEWETEAAGEGDRAIPAPSHSACRER